MRLHGSTPVGHQDAARHLPPLSVAPLDYNRFRPTDVAGWRAALDAYGFAVLAGVLSPPQVTAAVSLLWDYLEGRTGGRRSDPKTWNAWPKESFRLGMIQQDGTHCDGAWFVRGLPGVSTVFANLFGSQSLHVSFDGFPALRPLPAIGPSARDWYHIDHSLRRPGRWLAQGVVALTPSGDEDGGLVVWPCSHRLFPAGWGAPSGGQAPGGRAPAGPLKDFEMLRNYPGALAAMPRDRAGLGPVKVCVAAGDLVLWDSRTLHCNAPLGPIPRGEEAVPALAALVTAAHKTLAALGAEASAVGERWASLPVLDECGPTDSARRCGCTACRGDIEINPSAPLGRLGMYVCMQPAELTTASPLLREAQVRLRGWTGHAPFRDVEGLGNRVSGTADDANGSVCLCRN